MGPARFPPGDTVLESTPYKEALLAQIDGYLTAGSCPEGRLEVEAGETRLTCLIHHSQPFLAGLQERDEYSRVPLGEFAARARQLPGATCSLVRTDNSQVMMIGVHFTQRPVLQGSTRLVDPAHVLEVLAGERQDAALAFERAGLRTLLFLAGGGPARLFFGDPQEDPGGRSLEDRVLAFAFSPGAPETRVEVFTNIQLRADPEAGVALATLAESTQPPPPATVFVHLSDGREIRQRPFVPPSMLIGRDPTVDLFIDNLGVSRKHARLLWERGQFVIEDLDSANGTALNGQPVSRAAVGPGDRVQIGKFVVTVVRQASEPQVGETLLVPSGEPPPAGYLVGEGVAAPLKRGVVMGRGKGVDVPVRGWRVRPVHARLDRGPGGGLRLTCFGGARARVNGSWVETASVVPGDEIVVGRSRFRVSLRPEERS